MRTGGFYRVRYASALVAALSCFGLCAAAPRVFAQAQSGTDLQNCHISATGDMICDGSVEQGEVGAGTALGTLHDDTDTGTTTTGPTVSGSVIISNPNNCDGIQTISLGASSATVADGVATITFEADAPYRVGDRITVTGASQANFNGSYNVTAVSGKTVSYKLAEDADVSSPVEGNIFATGDVPDDAETNVDECQTIDTETTEQQQQQLDQLQQQIDQLQQLLTQLQQQLSNQTLEQQQQAAQALQQAQSSGGAQGLLGMLQQLLSGHAPTSTPGATSTTTNTNGPTTQAQDTANQKGQQDNGTDFNKAPGTDDPLCDLNKDDPVGSRPLDQAVNQEIVHRFSTKSPQSDLKNNVVVGLNGTFDAGVGKASGAYHATSEGTGFVLDDKAGVGAAISTAQSINNALRNVPKSELDHCFTTVIASAAYAFPNLDQMLMQAIQLANQGKYDQAAELAKQAVGGGKLGEDVSKAFKALGSSVQENQGLQGGQAPSSSSSGGTSSGGTSSGGTSSSGTSSGGTSSGGTSSGGTSSGSSGGSSSSGSSGGTTTNLPSGVPSGSTSFTPPSGSTFPALQPGQSAYQAPDGKVYYTNPGTGPTIYDSSGREVGMVI